MDIEKSIDVATSAERLWSFLLDPKSISTCVPGLTSIEVVSETEYVSVVQAKVSFINVNFRVRTLVTDSRAPGYLRSESKGEDAAAASSVKAVTEMFLTPIDDAHTRLRVSARTELLGRLGTFGLNVMKTKADRMWEEFGEALKARVETPGAATVMATEPGATSSSPVLSAVQKTADAEAPTPEPTAPDAVSAPTKGAVYRTTATPRSPWWRRLFASVPADVIRVEIRRGETVATIEWPGARASECAAWLREQFGQSANGSPE